MIKILQGNCIDKLKELDNESVQCVVTSPPYWALRDYGESEQLGLEKTPQEYVQSLVNVFKEVKRVLKDDGTVWLNLGDSYVGTGHKGDIKDPIYPEGRNAQKVALNHKVKGLKSKDLVGIPWRVAFALQDDGWYLRQDIIWAKPNPMPESVKDRCTKSHEYIFLLTKSAKYYYDAEAIKEPVIKDDPTNTVGGNKYPGKYQNVGTSQNVYTNNGFKNKRSVWTITTKPYSEAHFATFPTEIPELCIKAGTSEHGQCSNCKKPYIREIEREKNPDRDMESQRKYYAERTGRTDGHISGPSGLVDSVKFIGWIPDCDCKAEVQPQVVLDMFAGAGTTGLVADRLGRDSILIELNKDYTDLLEKRIYNDAPMFVEIESSK